MNDGKYPVGRGQRMRRGAWVFAFLVMVALALAAPAAQGESPPLQAGPLRVDDAIRRFGVLSAMHAWVLAGDQLLLTDDGGAAWREITPPALSLGGMAAVAFLDASTGWVATWDAPGVVTMAATGDGGRTWQRRTHPLFAPNDPAGLAAGLALHWLDRRTGWLVVKQMTSSNFNRGVLFGTQDGGVTWQQLSQPGGEPVTFISAARGWTASGPHGDTWLHTDDGGRSWSVVALPYGDVAGPGQRRHYPPIFTADGRHGVVVVATSTAAGQQVHWYVTDDYGAQWALIDPLAEPVAAASPGAYLDAGAWLMARTGQLQRLPTAAAPFFANPTVEAARITLATVAMATPAAGWAADARGAWLLRTADGGQRWQVQLAGMVATAPPATITQATGAPGAASVRDDRTARLAGPGFDMCELAGEEDLRRWITDSPYRAVNLYIGGDMRACDNAALDAQKLAALTVQGWTFIPTWVGPQAPCVYDPQDRLDNFASDPTTAYAQGRAEAERALQTAVQLQLADAAGAGTVIYYDLEAYDGQDTACVEAARAFVAGWTQRIQESQSYAGLYALACNPPLARYADLTPAPDAVWFAAWTRTEYDPAMTVAAGIPAWCLPPPLWSQQQRIRQYAGDHDETWGGVTLRIDSNVLDGIVADLGGVVKPPVMVIVETPEVTPAYADATACEDGWHRFTNVRGQPAYLAYGQPRGATIPPLNYGIWRPTLPLTGAYRVEALINSHGVIDWACRGQAFGPDTSRARYTVHHRDGVTTSEHDQLPLNDEWLRLGTYAFTAGSSAYVYLDAAVADAPRNVAFSAMRFVLEFEGELVERIYLPVVQR